MAKKNKKGKAKGKKKPKKTPAANTRSMGKKAKIGHRLLTPGEIIEYYRTHRALPPEIQRRIEK